MKRNKFSIGLAMAGLVSLMGCSDAPVGSKQRPFTMYFVPSVDAESIAVSAKSISEFVAREVSQKLYGKDEGFYVKSAIPTSYIAVVEAFGTQKADFAALTTYSYILTKDIKKYPVEAVFSVIRGKNETSYKSQIIARADSGIQSIEDLRGKNFAFTDPASTAGYILPAQLLKEKNIQLGNTVFGQKHDNVVTMVYQGQVDAGATYYSPPETITKDGKSHHQIRDARAKVLTQFPDVEKKVKIIGFSEEIPNDPWIIRSNLDKDPARNAQLKNAIQEAIWNFSATEEGHQRLHELYSITGLVKADDKVYQKIRETILNADLNLENVLADKKDDKKKTAPAKGNS